MKAVFLCAGHGKRMSSQATTGIPKPMTLLGDENPRPVLAYTIDNCKRLNGINEFLIVISKDDHMIEEYFGDGSKFDINIRYLTQDQPLGTAHAIRCAEQHIDDAFLVIYGDNIFTTGLVHHTKLIHEHTSNDTVATYALHYEPDKEKLKEFGTAEVDDEHHITRIVEKSPTPASSYVVTGIMIFEPIIFDVMKNPANWRKSPRDEYEIHDYTNLLIQGGRIVNANISTSSWMDLTRPGDIQRANKMIKEIYS